MIRMFNVLTVHVALQAVFVPVRIESLGFILMDSGGRLPHTASPSSTCEVYGDPIMHPQPGTYWGHANPISEMVVISHLGFCGQFDFVCVPVVFKHCASYGFAFVNFLNFDRAEVVHARMPALPCATERASPGARGQY